MSEVGELYPDSLIVMLLSHWQIPICVIGIRKFRGAEKNRLNWIDIGDVINVAILNFMGKYKKQQCHELFSHGKFTYKYNLSHVVGDTKLVHSDQFRSPLIVLLVRACMA